MLARVPTTPPPDCLPLQPLSAEARKPGAWRQFKALTARAMRNYMRDRIGFRTRFAQTLGLGALISLVFADLKNNQDGMQDRAGLIFLLVLSQGMSAIVQVRGVFFCSALCVARSGSDETAPTSAAVEVILASLLHCYFRRRSCSRSRSTFSIANMTMACTVCCRTSSGAPRPRSPSRSAILAV